VINKRNIVIEIIDSHSRVLVGWHCLLSHKICPSSD